VTTPKPRRRTKPDSEPTPPPPPAVEATAEVAVATSAVATTDADIADRVRLATAAALDKKALELKVLRLGAVTDFTDYFLIASGSNQRQVQAVADAIEDDLRRSGVRVRHTEGYPSGQWVLLDYGDFVVHVFDDERRHLYGLERLWSDAPDVTAEFVGTEPPSGTHSRGIASREIAV
jgi:ribosome-associated protein